MTVHSHHGPLIVTIVGDKGGCTKTTTAVALMSAAATTGHRVLGVDADPHGQLYRISDGPNWKPEHGSVMCLPGDNVSKKLAAHTHDRHGAPLYDVVVIDTDAMETNPKQATDVMMIADVVVFPCQPTDLDFDRFTPAFDVLENVVRIRPTPPLAFSVLTRSAGGARRLRAEGRDALQSVADLYADTFTCHVSNAVVPNKVMYAQFMSRGVALPPGDPYTVLWDEIYAAATTNGA